MKVLLAFLVVLSLGQYAYAACNKHTPCLVITITPPMPSWPDSTPVGTPIAQISVTLNPPGTFTGTVSFGFPYGDDGGLFAISGIDLVLARPLPPGNSTQYTTILATQ